MESVSSQVSVESSLDFTFAFNNAQFSDKTLQLKIMPVSNPHPIDNYPLTRSRTLCLHDQDANVHEAVQNNDNESSTDDPETGVKTIHINTAILTAKSPFFHKLFSNGMSEPNEQHVTLQIQQSDEAAFMDMLKFMYTNTLSSTAPSTLLAILIVADKYEVASCMKYCLQLLTKSPMTYESAVLYLDLPSTILMDDTVRLLACAAKDYLSARFNDISKFSDEIPLAALESVLSGDSLQVDSEDTVYDIVMKWAHKHYTKQSERQEILNTRLLRLIRFQYMSCDQLKELLSCTDINPQSSSELLFEALSFDRQLSLAPHKKERAYYLRPVKVISFDSPHEECVVYLDLKHEECARLLPDGRIYLRNFHYGGKTFYLLVVHDKENDNSSYHSFGLYLSMKEIGSMVEFEFSTRTKPRGEFVANARKIEYRFTARCSKGFRDLFEEPWDTFIAEDSPYFINGVLHLRAVIKLK